MIRIGIGTSVVAAEAVADACADLDTVEIAAAAGPDALVARTRDCDALVLDGSSYSRPLADALAAPGNRVAWLQFASAGYDPAQAIGVPAGVAVTNAHGVWGPTVAEHAAAMILTLLRALPQAERDRAARRWDAQGMMPALRSLERAEVGIVGFGGIGQQLAVRLRPFGAVIHAVTRHPGGHPLADRHRAIDDVRDALPHWDVVVLALPLTPATAAMADADWFDRMKPGALFVNVGRGGLVDEAALADALASGRLGGAALDVTREEPLPPDHAFWTLPGLLLTPHLAGSGGRAPQRLLAVCRDNIGRFAAGQPLRHVVALGPAGGAR